MMYQQFSNLFPANQLHFRVGGIAGQANASFIQCHGLKVVGRQR
jgi:hypothetical protein